MTAYEYDTLGRNTKVTEPGPDGAGGVDAALTETTYNDIGDVESTENELATGFEPVTFGFGGRRSDRVTTKHGTDLRETQNGEVPVLVPSVSSDIQGAEFPPDLAEVVAAWPVLPNAIKAGVLALVRAAVGIRQADKK